MFTVHKFAEAGLLQLWRPQASPLVRYFYYRPDWIRKVNALPGPIKPRGLTRDTSQRGRVQGVAERFARGEKFASLVTPVGDAMDPAFRRMRSPNEAVVELRTRHTRTFGFFSEANVYVAVTLQPTDILKAKPPDDDQDWTDPYLVEAGKVQELLTKYISSDSVDVNTDVELLVTP